MTLGVLAMTLLRSVPGADAPLPAEPPVHASSPSADAPQAPEDSQSTVSGMRGAHRVNAATALTPGAWVFGVGEAFGTAHGVLIANDTDTLQAVDLFVNFSPLKGLDVGLRQGLVLNDNPSFTGKASQSLGDPTLAVKYSAALGGNIPVSLGALLSVQIPTAAQSAGLSIGSSTVAALGVASYRAAPWLQLSLNGGWVLDGRNSLTGALLDRAQRFALGLPASSRAEGGLAVTTSFDLGSLGVGPFVEMWGEYAPGAPVREQPLIATVGAKVLLGSGRRVELAAGADLRLSGAPAKNAHFAGVLPWMLLGRIVVHIDDLPPPPPAPVVACGPVGPPPCDSDAACGANRGCFEGHCEVLRVVEKEAPAAKTFVISGTVLDKEKGRALSGARIVITEGQLTTGADGKFTSPPIQVGAGLIELKASAQGFATMSKPVPRIAASAEEPLVFALLDENKAQSGRLQAIATDAVTGDPVPQAIMTIPVLHLNLKADAKGVVESNLKTGQYDVIVHAPGYASQSKHLRFDSGETVILNVALHPVKKKR